MSRRHATALGRAAAWFLGDEVRPDEPEPDSEVLRPDTAPHSATETWIFSGCVTLLGFIICQDLIPNIFIALLCAPLFLQIAGMALIPLCGGQHGIVLVALLTAYVAAFLPCHPVTIAWLAMCGLNFTCWMFQQIAGKA